ncbi:MAG: hypothetical protein HWE20_06475 [Gammaproteobacteria bacterium]|nr:hypothetical protein [Gammaproteobacteria bacterium]
MLSIMTPEITQLVTAYNAMETTKQRHMLVLEAMENRNKKFGLPSSDQEEALLQRLLNDHNQAVEGFKQASMAAREQSPEQMAQVIGDLTALDQQLDQYRS